VAALLNDFNLDPAVDYQPTVVDQTRIKDLQAEHDELVQIARAEMDALYEQISGSGYALLLADTSGVILCEKIDPTLKRMFMQAGLIVGAEWSEKREGTNGIGTCAAESRPITIHQSDHFRSRTLVCRALRRRFTIPMGAFIAVLDASSVSTQAVANHRCIRLRWSVRRHVSSRNACFCAVIKAMPCCAFTIGPSSSTYCTTAPWRFGRRHHRRDRHDRAGVAWGQGAQGHCSRSIADIFDATFDELLATSSSSRRAMYELRDNLHGRRYFASLVGAGRHDSYSRVVPTLSTVRQSSRAVIHVSEPAQTRS